MPLSRRRAPRRPPAYRSRTSTSRESSRARGRIAGARPVHAARGPASALRTARVTVGGAMTGVMTVGTTVGTTDVTTDVTLVARVAAGPVTASRLSVAGVTTAVAGAVVAAPASDPNVVRPTRPRCGRLALVSSTFHTGRLLVATPSVEGDVFHRSVILVLHHDEAGAQGVVLNKPLSADVDSVLPGWQRVVTAPSVLFQGGPVATSSALGLVTVPGDEPEPLGVKRLFGSIGLVDLDVPTPVVAAELAGMRIFAGYAGWEGGQLEREVQRGDWYVVDAEVRDAFTPDPEGLWRAVLRRQRDSLAFVANFPADPSMN